MKFPMTVKLSKKTVAREVLERFLERGEKKYVAEDFETSWETGENGEEVLVLRLLPWDKRPRQPDEASEEKKIPGPYDS